ncbi:MAG TPA: bifunctional DNA primase/polymerase [Sedimentisphaerales bacterium]|nr:bifunctional DNA primase/polymerase [Sedimentisphaerales bacterium]
MTEKKRLIFKLAVTYHQLGWCVIPIYYGVKVPIRKWKQYQSERPSEGELDLYSRNVKRNIAVVLGRISGGLACRDFDTIPAYEEWALKYPDIAKVLPTAKTGRGLHVYFKGRLKGVTEIKDGNGNHLGELRGSRCCCLLPPSVHPNGSTYKWIIRPTKENLLYLKPEQAGFITTADDNYGTEGTDGNRGELKGLKEKRQVKINKKIREVMIKTLPVGFAIRHRKIFAFARELKSMPEYENTNPRVFRSVVKDWYWKALPNIKTKEFEETWIDFLMAWDDVKYKIGEEPLMQIFKRAAESKLPKIAVKIYPDNEQIQLLVAFCRELQLEAGEKPFFLSARTVGKLFNLKTMTAWRWMYLLVQDEILKVVFKGKLTKAGPKATRYNYIYPLKD